ncbi:MAG: hypothetical protein SGI94_12285 [Saprospiraceae bacterium]|nr:hypothetical protein [Saprospiraceae bacterium]
MNTTIATEHKIISAARALSDSAYDLACRREAIDVFITKGNHFYQALKSIELTPVHLLTRPEITLLELTSKSLHFLRELPTEQQSFKELLPVISKILPELDGLIYTAIVALDPHIWKAMQEIERGDTAHYKCFSSVEEIAEHLGVAWNPDEATSHIAE